VAIRFRNRTDAGDKLADRLRSARQPGEHQEPPVVLGLPRGGVPVAARVAEALHAPLDVLVIRKVGVPWQAELALGAVGEGGAKVLNRPIIASTGLSEDQVAALAEKAAEEVDRRVEHFRGGRDAVALEGREVIVVDDGIATGATMRAAVAVARARGASKVTVAVPVAAAQSTDGLAADDVVCLLRPRDLRGVGLWYVDFRQTGDAEVVELLTKARASSGP
jgi:putative phosphoribosyl transferase